MRVRWPRRYWLGGLLAVTGVTHFAAPRMYERIIPHALGAEAFWVSASGAAELTGAALLVLPRTRRLGAWWVAAVLVLVFPANVQMALDGGMEGASWPLGSPVVAWLRLPIQVPLVLWAVHEARRQPAARPRAPNRSRTASAQSP